MSVREVREGIWEIRVYLGIEAGRERYTYATIEGKKADALEIERKLAQEKGNSIRLSAYSLKLSQFLDFWLNEYILPYKAPKTCAFYELNLNKRIIPDLGPIVLRKLTPQDIQRFYNKTIKKRIDGKPGPLSGTSLRAIHRTLHAALERAVKLDLIESNPADRVELPTPVRFKPRVLTPDEGIRFLEAAQGTTHYALIATALFTGLRLGELLSLRWKNVDLSNGVITVEKSKTASGIRFVPIPSVAVNILKKQRDTVQGDIVFPGSLGGEEIQRTYLSSKVMPKLCEAAGLPRMRFHDLRHTHATWLSAMDISARTVADRLGHSDASFTLRTYAHVSLTAQRKAAAIVGEILEDTSRYKTLENPLKLQDF